MSHATTILSLVWTDIRRHRAVLGLFAVALIVASIVRMPIADGLFEPRPERLFDPLDRGLWLCGLLVASFFGRAHLIDRRAFWRTRPWSPATVLAAKLVEVLAVVWLPMAGLQLILLSTVDLPGKPWLVWTGELLLVVGGPLLAAAALGALTRSFRALVAVGGILALGLPFSAYWIRQLADLQNADYPATAPAVVFVTALGALAGACLWLDRRRVAWPAAVALAVGWVVVHAMPATNEPEILDPAVSIEVVEILPVEGRSGSVQRDQEWLCLAVEVDGRSTDGRWHSLSLAGTFRSDGFELGPPSSSQRIVAGNRKLWPSASHYEAAPSFYRPTAAIFNGTSFEDFERHRHRRGTVEVDIRIETQETVVLDAGPLRVGEVVGPVPRRLASPKTIDSITVRGRNMKIEWHQRRIEHLTDDEPADDPSWLKLDPLAAEFPSGYQSCCNSRFDRSFLPLPFPKAQQVQSIYSWMDLESSRLGYWPALDPDRLVEASLETRIPGMGWKVTTHRVVDRRYTRMTLDDVTLGELACDPKRRPALD